MNNKPIGISDSGVGGLSVVSRVMELLPRERIVYFADTAHVPYGDKSPEQIRGYVYRILEFFLKRRVKAVVFACNSSSALVLPEVCDRFPVPILGVIEPAVRVTLAQSRNGRLGLIANEATVKSGAYQKAVEICGNGVRLFSSPCPKLVPLVERGEVAGREARDALSEYLEPLKESRIDTLILGCTHYPFLKGLIAEILGEDVSIIDPAEQVARDLRMLLSDRGLLGENPPGRLARFFVSGDPVSFREIASRLLGRSIEHIKKVYLPESSATFGG